MGSSEGTFDEAKGRVKEAVGDLTDDDRLKREGKVDRAGAAVKNKAADLKDKIDEKVDELKSLLDRGTKADIIDVRHLSDFDELHIKGARSIPLRSVRDRSAEIKKTGLVVFY